MVDVKKWTHRLARMGWLFFLLWAGSIGTAEAPPGRGIPPAVWDARRPQDSQPVWFGPVSGGRSRVNRSPFAEIYMSMRRTCTNARSCWIAEPSAARGSSLWNPPERILFWRGRS
ncbi:MAG: hypothetical protein EBV83_06200 [Verrucomicrobia bacterium]|nr:hypothetical protein [Verrucomicrobiota bacterium]